jgi:16S rRNA (cytidine1402-2'-O)-methyltransferase
MAPDSSDTPAGSGTLFVVGTPIGNLQDLSPRAQEVLGRVRLIAAEDTRRTRILLSSIGVNTPLMACHGHNEVECAQQLCERLQAGDDIALVSDAGMPLLSDPGLLVVRAARDRGIRVISVPGPSAIVTALAAAGLPADRFVFEGFLPRKPGVRDARLAELRHEVRTMVFFEAVHRLPQTLKALAAVFGPDRRAVIARELTKMHEQVVDGTLASLCADIGERIVLKGEFVLLVAGSDVDATPDEAQAQRIFMLLAAHLPAREAVALTARITGLPRNAVYRLTRVSGEPSAT